MSGRGALLGLALGMATMATTGCAADCPGGSVEGVPLWAYDAETTVCQPSTYSHQIADGALVTGIWGYGMQCAENDSDALDCTCDLGEVTECGTFRIIDLDHVNGWPYDTLVVSLYNDGIFTAELPPNVRYRFGGPPDLDYGTAADGAPAGTFTLKDGEIRFFRASVGTKC